MIDTAGKIPKKAQSRLKECIPIFMARPLCSALPMGAYHLMKANIIKISKTKKTCQIQMMTMPMYHASQENPQVYLQLDILSSILLSINTTASLKRERLLPTKPAPLHLTHMLPLHLHLLKLSKTIRN